MKVLFVTRGFPSEKNIMAGNYEAVQAKALAAKGCNVSVITIQWKTIHHLFERTQISHRIVDGVDVYEGDCLRLSTRFKKLLFLDWKLKKRAYSKIFKRYQKENGNPDIVHAHIVSCGYMVSFIKDDYHLPFVITEHWTTMNKNVIPDWLLKMSQVYYKADALICVSHALADSIKLKFQIDCTVINNMVSDIFFKTQKVERRDNTIRFVACGAFRINRNKGFDILVDAFAQSRFSKNVILTIVGDGPDRAFIESKIADYRLSDQIHLVGVKTPEEVNDLLCHSDCFVLSSRLETFAIVVIEAMAKGLPVIATRSGGPETFLRPEHGILVQKENVDELAHAMQYMIEHHSDYQSEDIRAFCHDHFSQDVISDQIIGVYNKVLNNYQHF